MTPKQYFVEIWQRCELFSALHGFVAGQATAALEPSELLRAEWAARVSALDLYIHELIAQRLVAMLTGAQPACAGIAKLHIPSNIMLQVHAAGGPAAGSSMLDLTIRSKLETITYQSPDNIADGVRMISDCHLWYDVARALGEPAQTAQNRAKSIKLQLSLIVSRRNKIVHEGDLQPGFPRSPWPISRADLNEVKVFIESIVNAIDTLIV